VAELPRQPRRLRGQSPEFVTVADLLRKSRILRGQPPEEVLSELEGLRVLVTPSDSRVGSPEEGEYSLIVHPEFQPSVAEYNPQSVSVSEVTGSFSSTSDIGEEPEISELESEFAATPISAVASLTSSAPDSPRVERVITQDLPFGLIAIEEIASPEEEEGLSIPENQPIIELREFESIFYSPPRSTTWYLSLTNFLENPGLSFSPPRAPFHPTPRGFYPSSNISIQSTVMYQSLESFIHGGPSIPVGYQSLVGTFRENLLNLVNKGY